MESPRPTEERLTNDIVPIPVYSESPRGLITEPELSARDSKSAKDANSAPDPAEETKKTNDFTFKMPTKLNSTIGKSDTFSSNNNMLSYKFTKENVFYQPNDPNNESVYIDRQGDEYQT